MRPTSEGRARRAPLDDPAAQSPTVTEASRPRSTRSNQPETSPSCRRSCPERSSTSACRRPFAVASDEQVWLEFDQERMHLFDGETELALRGTSGDHDVGVHDRKAQDHRHQAYPVWVGIRNQLLVKVETDQGIYGWGESRAVGREKAVVGAIEHYPRVSHRPGRRCRSAASGRRCIAASTSKVGASAGGDLGDRHRPARHQGQGARRAGLRAARRQAARSHSDLRHHAAAASGPELVEQVRELTPPGWKAIRLIPADQRSDEIYRAARDHRRHTRQMDDQGA